MKRAVLLVAMGLFLSAAWLRPALAATSDDEKEGTIAGMAIKRANGGWIGVELKDNNFRITFYNDRKKPMPADRSSAVLWWPVHYQPNAERTELLPTDDTSTLASAYAVKLPHTFKLHISLLAEDKEPESYVVDFSD